MILIVRPKAPDRKPSKKPNAGRLDTRRHEVREYENRLRDQRRNARPQRSVTALPLVLSPLVARGNSAQP
jgi:hypothetical protein